MGKKKKNQWRRSHTSCSQDLSPWQLSPPASTCTNWNSLCLCVSISFISSLKVNVPLNEITHSVWVPLLRVPCLISSSFGQTWNRSTYFIKLPTQTLLTLDFSIPLGHNRIYLVRSALSVCCQARRDSEVLDGQRSVFPLAERRRQIFTLVLFLSFHPAVPPRVPSDCHHAAHQRWSNDVIISSHLSAGPLDPWACARDTLARMCCVQLWTRQNNLIPRCLRLPKCCKIASEKSSWLTFEPLQNTAVTLNYLCLQAFDTNWHAEGSACSELRGNSERSKHSWWCMAGFKHNQHPGRRCRDMTRKSWPLAEVIAGICLWPVITQKHGGSPWCEVTGPFGQLVDCPRILRTPSVMMKYAGTFLFPIQESHSFTSAAGVWEAAVREKDLSIKPSLWQLTRSLGFMWLPRLCISRLLFMWHVYV